MWNICGAQKARRKRDWIEVEIGIPESWWREDGETSYKRYLAGAIEEGLRSMIDILQRKDHTVDSNALLRDWERIKADFLTD